MIFAAFFKVEKRLVRMKGRNVLTRRTLVHSKMENVIANRECGFKKMHDTLISSFLSSISANFLKIQKNLQQLP